MPGLSDEEKTQIRSLWAKGTKQREIAAQFDVSQACVSNVVYGIPKVRVQRPERRCVDCGIPLRFKRRCENCLPAWKKIYNQQRYANLKKAENTAIFPNSI